MIQTYQAKAVGKKVFVTMPSAMQKSIKLKSGAEIIIPDALKQEEWATVVAQFHSQGGLSKLPLQQGDNIAVSYKLSSDYRWEGDRRVYRRAHQIGDTIVWECDPEWIFAFMKEDGSWQAIGDWILLKEIDDVPPIAKGKEILEDAEGSYVMFGTVKMYIPRSSFTKKKGRGLYVSGGENIPMGSEVLFDEGMRSLYKFPDGQEFIVLPTKLALAYEA